jgi:hypothetical protein
MNHRITLTVASLLSVVLVTIHLADDVARGIDEGDLSMFTAVPFLALWAYAALLLAERRAGYVIILLLSLAGVGICLLHMRGNGLAGGRIAGTEGILFWAWTLLTLGVTCTLSIGLALQGLWRLRRKRGGAA